MIAIIDYNVGNLLSVQSAFDRLEMESVITRDPIVIKQAKGIVLPGVGTFKVAMQNLKQFGLIEIISECKDKGVPILGICLGMQILFEKGFEVEETKGLGFIPGVVDYMNIDEKIPHMGWNQLVFCQESPLLQYIDEHDDVYFVHSYMATCPQDNLVAYSMYGSNKITAIVKNKNVMGCQFHPEKSGKIGSKILMGFREMIG
ncbi:imidazole glycerol phosphate synthase subunit HisH [Tannockella kyphosi]|uniref:imidazole glycerol phosphate synthase subunit HisH n=1 Tax=Tannockella kyphosi TaxID=2899121 RepID=UPI002013B813|nr:imidazole glycerol phosphate synthase subunit HisH [Tannockella kyphosi]